MTRLLDGIEELTSLVGERMGWSAYTEATQAQVQQFADATGDHQWIHVDVGQAEGGPCGGAPSTQEFTFEVEGADKPSCVAQVIFRYAV